MKLRTWCVAAGAAALAVTPTAALAQSHGLPDSGKPLQGHRKHGHHKHSHRQRSHAGGGQVGPAHTGSGIVLFKSIAGASLGMTPGQIKRKLGNPSHSTKSSSVLSYEYDNSSGIGTMDVTFDSGRATSIQTFLTSVSTPQGIHVGSSVAALKRAYEHRLKHAIGGFAIDNVTRNAETQFIVGGGKVESIAIFTF